jgi:hypothetical protein
MVDEFTKEFVRLIVVGIVAGISSGLFFLVLSDWRESGKNTKITFLKSIGAIFFMIFIIGICYLLLYTFK